MEKRMEKREKICPLLSVTSLVWVKCQGQRCAWWIVVKGADGETKYEGCALVLAAESLHDISRSGVSAYVSGG